MAVLGMTTIYFFADYLRMLEYVAVVMAIVIIISSVDDILIDVYYWTRRIHRHFKLGPDHQRLSESDLHAKPEQPFAIMVPAWHEYDVIAPMLEAMIAALDYRSYRIYVGTYCNDERTIAEVERMRLRYKVLMRVEVPHAGPTCKADCLNWIVKQIFLDQANMPEPYAGMVLHDCEDVLHPLELKYFNYLLPRIDFIQLPVRSLERQWHEFVAGTYMDEFAESHTKDLVVREFLSGMVPSAGVGTCFSERAIKELSDETQNQPFNTSTLTEDYDIGARLARKGMEQIFAKFPVQYARTRRSLFGLGKERTHVIYDLMSVREYFPSTFRTAYRQKSRWTLGISFQGWKQVGWEGSLVERYFYFRDRKGLVTPFVTMVAYFLLINFVLFQAAQSMGWGAVFYPTTFAPGSWQVGLLMLNLVFFTIRVGHRLYFVNRLYGWVHALLSLPRMVVGNFVNAMAAARAWRLFLVNYIFGSPLVWDKTMHDFPSDDVLSTPRQALGEILVGWHAISKESLEKALAIQRKDHRRLGEILVENQLISEVTLHEAISFQQQWNSAETGANEPQKNSEAITG